MIFKLCEQGISRGNCRSLHPLHIKKNAGTENESILLFCVFLIYSSFKLRNQRVLRGIIKIENCMSALLRAYAQDVSGFLSILHAYQIKFIKIRLESKSILKFH